MNRMVKHDVARGAGGRPGRPRLPVDLVPAGAWFASPSRALPPAAWARVRERVFEDAGHRCEACRRLHGGLEVHAVWRYDDLRHVQTLVRLAVLCPACHAATHPNEALARGRGAD